MDALTQSPAGDRSAGAAGRSEGLGTAPLLALIWLVGASAALLLLWGSKLTFFLDDWEFLLYRPGFDAHSILAPHGEHIVVLPVLIYKALLATFGMGSALPYRVVSTGLFLLSAVFLFAYLRRRVGPWPALAGVAVVLFLGAAWEDLLWAFQMSFFGSVACGLGALLAIGRRDRTGDVAACMLGVISILFSSLGLPFVAGLAVAVLLRPGRGRRAYVFLVPLAVYAIWWLGWGHTAESHITFTHVAETPRYVLDGVAAALVSVFGLADPGHGGTAGQIEWGRALAVGAAFLAVWRILRIGRVPPGLWVVLAVAATFWILAGFNQIPGREATSSRYQYLGVVFVLLIASELLQGIRLERRLPLTLILLAAAASVASNVNYLHYAYASNYHPASRLEKASLGAVEIARDTVAPDFFLSEELTGTGYVYVDAGTFLATADAHGSPAYDEAEIAAAPGYARFAADKVLFGALRIGVAARPSKTVPATAPAVRPVGGLARVPAGGCVSVSPEGGESPLLELPPGGVLLRAGRHPITAVDLARFSRGRFPIEITEEVAPGRAALIRIPADRAALPWRARLELGGTAVVCGRRA